MHPTAAYIIQDEKRPRRPADRDLIEVEGVDGFGEGVTASQRCLGAVVRARKTKEWGGGHSYTTLRVSLGSEMPCSQKCPVGSSVGSVNSLLNMALIPATVLAGSSPLRSLTALATWRVTSARTSPHAEVSFQVSGRRAQTNPPFATHARRTSLASESPSTSDGTARSRSAFFLDLDMPTILAWRG